MFIFGKQMFWTNIETNNVSRFQDSLETNHFEKSWKYHEITEPCTRRHRAMITNACTRIFQDFPSSKTGNNLEDIDFRNEENHEKITILETSEF